MALETAANAIRSCIRESDLLIRYGGDEFLLVLPGIPGDILQTKLEQIRTAAQMASVPGCSHFRLSLSIGGTIQAITDPMENAVRRADRLMYQAKCRKNAVTVEVPGCSLAAPEKLLQEKSQILLVDDSKMNRMILAEILGDGYHIQMCIRDRAGAGQIRIFAKIESLAGVQALPEFLSLVDEVVIARGDLGNAMPLWELPRCQKQLSAVCRSAGVPFMVVTQMLDSMCSRAVPTRAEVSDIYNAVADGASSVMLTGETAAGQYPVEAMEYLVRTARTALE